MPNKNILISETSLFDASEQALAQNWLPIEINQLSAGNYSGQLRNIEHPDVSVFFEHQNCTVHKRGITDENFCTVSFFRGTQSQLRFSEYNPADNTLFFLPSSTEFDIQVTEYIDTVYYRFDQSTLLERLTALEPTRWQNEPKGILAFDSIDRRTLDFFTETLYSSTLFQPNTRSRHQNELFAFNVMDHFAMTLNSSSFIDQEEDYDLIARRRTTNLVKLAIEYIKTAFEQLFCPSIVDVCYELKISQRTLQYSFKSVLGITPITYIRYLRLNQVRIQLANPINKQVTVTAVAMQWHFFHLGKFAQNYQELFFERPSTTLMRSLESSFFNQSNTITREPRN